MFEAIMPHPIQTWTVSGVQVAYNVCTTPRRQLKTLFHWWLQRRHVGDLAMLAFFSVGPRIFLARRGRSFHV
jgi:hypothetical protein